MRCPGLWYLMGPLFRFYNFCLRSAQFMLSSCIFTANSSSSPVYAAPLECQTLFSTPLCCSSLTQLYFQDPQNSCSDSSAWNQPPPSPPPPPLPPFSTTHRSNAPLKPPLSALPSVCTNSFESHSPFQLSAWIILYQERFLKLFWNLFMLGCGFIWVGCCFKGKMGWMDWLVCIFDWLIRLIVFSVIFRKFMISGTALRGFWRIDLRL